MTAALKQTFLELSIDSTRFCPHRPRPTIAKFNINSEPLSFGDFKHLVCSHFASNTPQLVHRQDNKCEPPQVYKVYTIQLVSAVRCFVRLLSVGSDHSESPLQKLRTIKHNIAFKLAHPLDFLYKLKSIAIATANTRRAPST